MFREEKGFTLIELIVVVAIIAILGAVITPNILKAIENSRVVAVIADSSVIKNAAMAYHADTGQWPVNAAGSEESGEDSGKDNVNDPGFIDSEVDGWNGPYLDRWPEKNPWGGTYKLVYKENNDDESKKKLYLQASKVPVNAIAKLQEKMGKNVVTAEENEENNNLVSIYLAE